VSAFLITARHVHSRALQSFLASVGLQHDAATDNGLETQIAAARPSDRQTDGQTDTCTDHKPPTIEVTTDTADDGSI